MLIEDMVDNRVSSLLAEDRDSEEVHWLDVVPLCGSSALLASLGLLLKLSLFMVEPF